MTADPRFFVMSDKMKESSSTSTANLWAAMEGLFNECPVGKSFAVKLEPYKVTEAALRTLVSREAKKVGKVFRVIKHKEHGCFEVGRPEAERAPIAPLVQPIDGWGTAQRTDKFENCN